jgi:hypothetical protein
MWLAARRLNEDVVGGWFQEMTAQDGCYCQLELRASFAGDSRANAAADLFTDYLMSGT